MDPILLGLDYLVTVQLTTHGLSKVTPWLRGGARFYISVTPEGGIRYTDNFWSAIRVLYNACNNDVNELKRIVLYNPGDLYSEQQPIRKGPKDG